jgi:hypothetical protein
MRVVGENQDESKRPFKRRRTRQETLRKPSINHQRHFSQSLKYRQHIPPSKKTPPSLKHAESVRNAIVTRDGSTATQDAARQEKDNNHGKQAKSMRVAREKHAHSLVSWHSFYGVKIALKANL